MKVNITTKAAAAAVLEETIKPYGCSNGHYAEALRGRLGMAFVPEAIVRQKLPGRFRKALEDVRDTMVREGVSLPPTYQCVQEVEICMALARQWGMVSMLFDKLPYELKKVYRKL